MKAPPWARSPTWSGSRAATCAAGGATASSRFREDEAREVLPGELERAALASGAGWVSFTGGEPTWRGDAELKALAGLARRLRVRGLKVKVESNGRRLPKALAGCVDLWSIAPKCDGRLGRAHAGHD